MVTVATNKAEKLRQVDTKRSVPRSVVHEKLERKMNIGRALNPFIRCFYICGLSCYPSFDEFLTRRTKNKSSRKYIPTAALLAITVITSISTFAFKQFRDSASEPSVNTIFVNISTLIITVLICAIQMAYLSPYFAEICSQISIIERLSWRKFTFDLNAFRSHFMRRACVTLISFIMPISVKVYLNPLSREDACVTIGLAILRALMFMNLLQAFFYVDLLDHMLQCFVAHVSLRAATATTAIVQTVNFRSPAAKQLKAEILHFKLLHFNLWEISEKINHLFGWTIVAVFLQHFIYAVYNVYFGYSLSVIQQAHGLSVFVYLRKCLVQMQQK